MDREHVPRMGERTRSGKADQNAVPRGPGEFDLLPGMALEAADAADLDGPPVALSKRAVRHQAHNAGASEIVRILGQAGV